MRKGNPKFPGPEWLKRSCGDGTNDAQGQYGPDATWTKAFRKKGKARTYAFPSPVKYINLCHVSTLCRGIQNLNTGFRIARASLVASGMTQALVFLMGEELYIWKMYRTKLEINFRR